MRTNLVIAATALLALAACEGCKSESKTPAAPPTKPADSRPSVDPQQRARQTQAEAPTLAPVPDTPLTGEDTASCDPMEDLTERVACLGSLAQRHRDPRYCESIAAVSKAAGEKAPELLRSGTAANACRRTIAFMRDDAKLCASIPQTAMAGSCLSYFAMKRRDPAVCELAPGEAAMTCYLNEAARTRDPALCKKTGSFEEDCNKRLGPVSP